MLNPRTMERFDSLNEIHTPEYRVYHKAKQRCQNPNNPKYRDYGGRGVEFRFTSYLEFLTALGRRPSPTYQVDRIDNNGHYEVANVRWATPKEQALNRRSNVLLTLDGETMTAHEWAERLGIAAFLIRQRKQRDGQCDECSLRIASGWHRCSHKSSTRLASSSV